MRDSMTNARSVRSVPIWCPAGCEPETGKAEEAGQAGQGDCADLDTSGDQYDSLPSLML